MITTLRDHRLCVSLAYRGSRWEIVARGLGCEGLYAEGLDELESALQKARFAEGPVVICVRTDRAANLAVPPDGMVRFFEVYQGPM